MQIEWTDAFFTSIESKNYWSTLCPSLHVQSADEPFFQESLVWTQLELAEAQRALKEEGYLCFHERLDKSLMEKMAQALSTIQETLEWPVFVFMYDEFWLIFRYLEELLTALLGEGFKILPDFWAWHIAPNTRETGWRPHRDRMEQTLQKDGTPDVLTLWIPLTDATPQNGCIYAVPAHLDPFYHSPGRETRVDNWHHIRALPAKAGSILAWTPQLLHWGSRSTPKATHPRISFAFELQRKDTAPHAFPLLDYVEPPDFAMRLALIGEQLHQYRHMYELPEALRKWSILQKNRLPKKRRFSDLLKKTS